MTGTISDYFYATVAYADIFDYPLRVDEVYYWFIQRVPTKNLRSMSVRGVVRKGEYYTLSGRGGIVEAHQKRWAAARGKWDIARNTTRWLRLVPTIKLVGVTGGLAMNNVEPQDDIDIMVITAKGTLWITRLLATFVCDLAGKRRKRGDSYVANKLCLNMFVSEEALAVEPDRRDLFTAHELLQMEPLWHRGDMYRRLLQVNKWASKLLPVAYNIRILSRNKHPKHTSYLSRIVATALRLFEWLAKFSQLWYMSRYRTTEVISRGVLRFHPRDARPRAREALAKRLAKRKLPLDNIFWAR